MSKEEFKAFVKDKPNLAQYVNSGQMTWQKFYEMYSLYGKDSDVWDNYKSDRVSKETISNLIKKGDNKITLETDFAQSEKVYRLLEDVYEFEVMKNKLYYDRELENIYLLGSFSVKSESGFCSVSDGSLLTDGNFVITEPKSKVNDGELVTSGFAFYTGKMTLEKTINLTKDEIYGRIIELERMGAVVTKLKVNQTELPAVSGHRPSFFRPAPQPAF